MGEPGAMNARKGDFSTTQALDISTLLKLYFTYRDTKELPPPLRTSRDDVEVYFKSVDHVVEQQKEQFHSMCGKMRPNLSVLKRDYYIVLNNLFQDEPTWPRVLTAIAFTYSLAAYCEEHGPHDAKECLPGLLQTYLTQPHLIPTLQRQGGMIGFRDFCQDYLNNSLSRTSESGLNNFKKVLFSFTSFSIRMVLGSNEVCS